MLSAALLSPSPRIPAWKRLGLKLKNRTVSSIPKPAEVPALKKRKLPDSHESEKPGKRSKSSFSHILLANSSEEPVPPPLVRKKSVTFTPETKEEDGESIKQLFDSWLAEQKDADSSFQLSSASQAFSTPNPPKVEEYFDPSLDEAERRTQRVKKQKAREKESKSLPKPSKADKSKYNTHKVVKITKTSSRPFLEYLRQYTESRATWKFNKNHQTHLLKNVFDIDVIPSDHAHFIYRYVCGLQGGVRTRLRDAALAVKVKDQEAGEDGFPEKMADKTKRQLEYEAAMEEYVASMTAAEVGDEVGYEEGVLLGLSNASMKKRVAQRMRSEKILAELSVVQKLKSVTSAEPANGKGDFNGQKPRHTDDASSPKPARKRKQRTSAVDENTSSSGDSDASDDDSSEDEVSRRGTADETSSSSSSSSSSSDESGDSDEDEDSEDPHGSDEDDDNNESDGSSEDEDDRSRPVRRG